MGHAARGGEPRLGAEHGAPLLLLPGEPWASSSAIPRAAIPLPRSPRLPRGILTESQARRLVAAPFPGSRIGKRDRAILELLYGTGVRLGEAARADVSDLDLRAAASSSYEAARARRTASCRCRAVPRSHSTATSPRRAPSS